MGLTPMKKGREGSRIGQKESGCNDIPTMHPQLSRGSEARMPFRAVLSWGEQARTLHPASDIHWMEPPGEGDRQQENIVDRTPNSWGHWMRIWAMHLRICHTSPLQGKAKQWPTRTLSWRPQRPYQEGTAACPARTHTYTCPPVSKNKEFLGQNFILLLWQGIPGSFSSLLRPSEPFQQKQFYLWYWTIPEKKKSPAREKMRGLAKGSSRLLNIFLTLFSGQKFPFIKFVQLDMSSVSFSSFPFF